MEIKMELLKRGCQAYYERITKAIDEAYEQIVTVVKECGGLLKTPASSDKSILYAYYEDFDGHTYHEAIHGLRWDDELGLTICTDSMLENYQFDTRYYFDYFYDFNEADLAELNKVLDDAAYFVEFDKYELVRTETILSIIGGLGEYL